MNEHFKQVNRNKYLTIVPTNESKEKNKKKYKELWIKINNQVRNRSIIRKLGDHDENIWRSNLIQMTISLWKKTIEIRIIALVVSVVFLKINEYYQHVFLDECLYKIWMKSNNELKEIDIKNRVYFYFDVIINGTKINFSNILSCKKLYQSIITFHIKFQQVQNYYVLGSIK